MTRVLITAGAEVWVSDVDAAALAPGSVIGPRIDRVFEAEARARGITADSARDGHAAGTALGRLSDPGDIASMAVFPASDGARMASGQVLTVDGFTITPDPEV